MGAYYRSDGTSRLLMAAGTSLYSDSPHLITNYDTQSEWQTGAMGFIDATTTPGEITVPSTPQPNPTFARASIAFQQNGASVASGNPRYEFHRIPQHRWQDLFNIDQISTHYTSGGDVPATWTVSNGVLSATGGEQATLLRTGSELS